MMLQILSSTVCRKSARLSKHAQWTVQSIEHVPWYILQLPYSPRVAKNVISTPASLPDTTHQGPLFGLALLGHGDPEGEFCGHM